MSELCPGHPVGQPLWHSAAGMEPLLVMDTDAGVGGRDLPPGLRFGHPDLARLRRAAVERLHLNHQQVRLRIIPLECQLRHPVPPGPGEVGHHADSRAALRLLFQYPDFAGPGQPLFHRTGGFQRRPHFRNPRPNVQFRAHQIGSGTRLAADFDSARRGLQGQQQGRQAKVEDAHGSVSPGCRWFPPGDQGRAGHAHGWCPGASAVCPAPVSAHCRE